MTLFAFISSTTLLLQLSLCSRASTSRVKPGTDVCPLLLLLILLLLLPAARNAADFIVRSSN